MIKVFHGSYLKIVTPDISFSRNNLDFGKGFYVTPLYSQAVNWAMRWKRRLKKAIVNSYCFYDERIADLRLKVKTFPVYDSEWLHYVADNRDGRPVEKYDIVQGGIANDKVFNTQELYFARLISENEALNRLKFEKPNCQICICRQKLINPLLSFEDAVEVEDGGK
ncbi:MAG: DUF3990 domain-containing protein [Victivallales bacterium]|nr:DUF3990 domain-containing protein [Victivallales bacterium]